MSHLPVLSHRDVERALLCLGFQVARQRGSHVFFRHPDGRTTTVPNHPGSDMAPTLLREIIREAGVTRDDFLRALAQ